MTHSTLEHPTCRAGMPCNGAPTAVACSPTAEEPQSSDHPVEQTFNHCPRFLDDHAIFPFTPLHTHHTNVDSNGLVPSALINADHQALSSYSNHSPVKPTAAVKLSAFEIVCLLGKGGFGKVLLVRHKAEPGSLYAMKVMNKSLLASRNAIRDAQAERNILAMLGHDECPFVVNLHVAFQTEKRVYLVMDFAGGGEIMFHLRKLAMLSEEHARFYAAELLVAIELLHSKRILHRDIKPENVLLASDGHLLLTDFGLAKDLSAFEDPDAEQNHSWCGSEDYMAPEIIAREPHTGRPADWWAFGIFLFDCLCGHPPFSPLHEMGGKGSEKKNRKKLHDRILKCKYKMPSYLTSECHSLIRGLLTRDPNKRLVDPEAIRGHPWFRSVDWNAVKAKSLTPPIIPPQGSPTACFSPSVTAMDFSAPHSPLALSAKGPANKPFSDPVPIPVGGVAVPISRGVAGDEGCEGKHNPSAPPSLTTDSDGLGFWEGFSFVAPGMEVHFQVAPTGEHRRTASNTEDFPQRSTLGFDRLQIDAATGLDLSGLSASLFRLSPSPAGSPCGSPISSFTAPPTIDQLAAEMAEFNIDAEAAVKVTDAQ